MLLGMHHSKVLVSLFVRLKKVASVLHPRHEKRVSVSSALHT